MRSWFMFQETEVRKQVKALKKFYQEVIQFIVVNVILMVIWLTFDKSGSFWPKYILVVWGLFLFWRAYRLGIASLLFHRSSFLNKEWEEKKSARAYAPP